jgi:hypothetical protein
MYSKARRRGSACPRVLERIDMNPFQKLFMADEGLDLRGSR